jgi:hypothetical protein
MAVNRYTRQHSTKRFWLVRLMGRPTGQSRRCRARQQNRSNGLGHDGARRAFQYADVAAGSGISVNCARKI